MNNILILMQSFLQAIVMKIKKSNSALIKESRKEEKQKLWFWFLENSISITKGQEFK